LALWHLGADQVAPGMPMADMVTAMLGQRGIAGAVGLGDALRRWWPPMAARPGLIAPMISCCPWPALLADGGCVVTFEDVTAPPQRGAHCPYGAA
jgi:hypothetical protein